MKPSPQWTGIVFVLVVTSFLGSTSACGSCSPSPQAGGDDDADAASDGAILDGTRPDAPPSPEGASDAKNDVSVVDAGADSEAQLPLCDANLPAIADASFPDAALAFVPIEVANEDGIRLVVGVQVDGVPFRAMLDTGSPGLRVLASAVADASLAPVSDASVVATFNGGLALIGYAAHADVTLNGLVIHDALIQVVTTACTDAADAASCDTSATGIFGDLPAILGVSLRPAETPDSSAPTLSSPLSALPELPAFVVQTYGSGATPTLDGGVLQIGVPRDAYASFPYWVPLPSIGDAGDVWNDLTPRTCIRDESSGAGCIIQGTFVDTGDPSPYIESLDAGLPGNGEAWGAGTAEVRLLGPANACLFGQYETAASSVHVRLVESTLPRNNPGYEFFYHFDVLYDPYTGRMAFRPR